VYNKEGMGFHVSLDSNFRDSKYKSGIKIRLEVRALWGLGRGFLFYFQPAYSSSSERDSGGNRFGFVIGAVNTLYTTPLSPSHGSSDLSLSLPPSLGTPL
jgi:hypothetical protein